MNRFTAMVMLLTMCLCCPFSSLATASKAHPGAIYFLFRFAKEHNWPTWAFVLIVVGTIYVIIDNMKK